jgi:hypothetical protein
LPGLNFFEFPEFLVSCVDDDHAVAKPLFLQENARKFWSLNRRGALYKAWVKRREDADSAGAVMQIIINYGRLGAVDLESSGR